MIPAKVTLPFFFLPSTTSGYISALTDSALEHVPESDPGGTCERQVLVNHVGEDVDLVWPDQFPALTDIEADDQGRLFVFPYVVETDATEFPVDVYTADGDLIANGMLPFQGWDAHRGEHVYRVEQRAGRTVIVRYRLQLPSTTGAAISAGQ